MTSPASVGHCVDDSMLLSTAEVSDLVSGPDAAAVLHQRASLDPDEAPCKDGNPLKEYCDRSQT